MAVPPDDTTMAYKFWELAGLLLVSRFELCVVIHTNEAQFLGDIRAISFCAEADGHCVRHVRRASQNVQDSLGRHVHGHVERLKPGLRHALSVSLGETGFSLGAALSSLWNV